MAPARFRDTVVSSTVERLHQMKKALSLPYDLSALQWDTTHRQNSSHTYCYCGHFGSWFKSMVQCAKCEQWFHERCLSPRPMSMPILDGDPFYLFICSVCNQGKECLKRIDFDLPDLVHLIMFNLTLATMKKGHRFDLDILSYVESKWAMFQPPPSLVSLTPWERRNKVLHTLLNHKDRFGMFRQKQVEASTFWLRVVAPPPGPRFRVPSCKMITEKTIMDEIYVGRNKVDPAKLETCLPAYLFDTWLPSTANDSANFGRGIAPEKTNNNQSCDATTKNLERSQKSAEKECTTNISSHTANETAFLPKAHSLVLGSNPSQREKTKFKFPKVAMKFCSNQKLKIDEQGNQYVASISFETEIVKRPQERNATCILTTNEERPTELRDNPILSQCLPVPESFIGGNNPFVGGEPQIRKMFKTRKLEAIDITKKSKIVKMRRTTELAESKPALYNYGQLQNGLDHDIWIKPNQPATSSSSSECSRSGSRTKSNSSNNNNKCNRSSLNNEGNVGTKTKTLSAAKSSSDTGMKTRTRVSRASSGSTSRQVIIGRRIISPGVFEYLFENQVLA